ncbi:MAG: SPOR domain-containing protein [Terracidiphilus sp.]
MRGIFDSEKPAPARQGRDTELTLGSGTLLAIFFGLVLICGVCFGLGYAVGHRGASETDAGAPTAGGAPPAFQGDGSRPKPSASAAPAVEPAPGAMADLSASAELPSGAETVSSPAGQNTAAAGSGAPGSGALVRPALPAVAIQGQAPQAGAVAPAMGAASAGGLMVQIAAVTNQEDADVLMSALRKRGYAVVIKREAADGMIHVRTGPFNGRDEAEKWRQKLLNDGYNAIVQP